MYTSRGQLKGLVFFFSFLFQIKQVSYSIVLFSLVVFSNCFKTINDTGTKRLTLKEIIGAETMQIGKFLSCACLFWNEYHGRRKRLTKVYGWRLE